MKDFIKFILGRQELYMRREAGLLPWSTDPVYEYAKINNCWRHQDRFSKYEWKEIKDKEPAEQVFRILLLRHTISTYLYEVLMAHDRRKPELFTKQKLLDLKEKIGSGTAYINTCILFPQRKGLKREDRVVNHYQNVCRTYRSFTRKLMKCKTALEAVDLIGKTYPELAPFRTYEVYTSLTYLDWFPWTENDYLFIGPGSKDVMIQYLGVDNPGLDDAYKLAKIVEKKLIAAGLTLPPVGFTVRTLEDSFCEFRKYTKAKTTGRPSRYYKRSPWE